jgi:hypothetical protein
VQRAAPKLSAAFSVLLLLPFLSPVFLVADEDSSSAVELVGFLLLEALVSLLEAVFTDWQWQGESLLGKSELGMAGATPLGSDGSIALALMG